MTPDPSAPPVVDAAPDAESQAPVEVEELLVEEVSIDGLCGVY